MQEQYDIHTDGAKKKKNTGEIILSINRVITLWREDIAESQYCIRHHKVNIQVLENHIRTFGVLWGNSSRFTKESAAASAKISEHQAKIEKHNDFIDRTEQDIINLSQVVNAFKHSPKAMKNVNNKGKNVISTVESIDRAISMLNERIVGANDAQIAEYLNSQKNGSEFVGKNHFVIDIYKQDIENLRSLCYVPQEMTQDDFYQKIR